MGTKNPYLVRHFILNWSFYPDRLGTSIRKTQKEMLRFSQAAGGGPEGDPQDVHTRLVLHRPDLLPSNPVRGTGHYLRPGELRGLGRCRRQLESDQDIAIDAVRKTPLLSHLYRLL